MNVVVIRHGETEWSLSGQHTGRTDIPLTSSGRDQAAAIAPRLAGHEFSLVLTSPLSRAVDTCALAGLPANAKTDPDLMEWNYGAYEGLTSDQIREGRPGWWMWTDGCLDGESIGDVAARVDRVIALCRSMPGDSALVAHGHVLRVLAARWLGAPGELGANLMLSTASVSILGYEHDTPAIIRWNDTAHLFGPEI
jgi:broad specificity phosphatase PhoE